MDKERWRQIEEIVDQALSIDLEEERMAFLNKELLHDQGLKKEVTSLLDSIVASQGLWEDLMVSNEKLVADMNRSLSPDLDTATTSLPNSIGPYRIKELLGRGGMGIVYLAKRIDSDFHQNVALKVLQREVYNEEAHRRFIQERKILSNLNHPNIARLLDGGISEGGRPYFVMEYVEGLPVTDYCSKNECSLDQRLSLFSQACKAVQYAHTNFIVHRDLKPANLLVTEDKILKVLDFGIAKLTDRELNEEQLIQTRANNRILSLSFAAPEQLTGEPVTAATDVYTLGLLLYELITDIRTFNLKGMKLVEAERIIRNKNPEIPSSTTDRWHKKIKGDLDAIILKALRKHPKDRYESVNHLLDDIKKYKNNIPVRARKGTFQYNSAKFIKRNKVALSAAFLFFLSGLLFTGYHVQQITKERNIAQKETEKARAVTGFMTGIFEYANPYKHPDADITAQEILTHGTKFIKSQIKGQPEIKASLLSTVGGIYETLGSYDKAEPLLEEALKLEQSNISSVSGDVYGLAVAHHNLGNLKSSIGDFKIAIENYKVASSLFHDLDLQSYRAGSLGSWGWNEYRLANYEKADSLLHLALSLNKEYDGSNSLQTANTLNFLGWLQNDLGNYHKADSIFTNVLNIRQSSYEDDHPETATTLHSLAWIKYQIQDYEIASKLLEEAIEMRISIFGDKPHHDIAWSKNNLGLIKEAQGDLDEAEKLFTEALEIRKKVLPQDHPHISQSLGNLGSVYFYRNEYGKSADIFKNVVDIQREILGPEHPNLAMYLNNLATVLTQAKKPEQALLYYSEALDIQNRNFGNTHSNTMRMRDNMADAHEDLKQFEKAEALRLENFNAIKAEKGLKDEQTQQVLKNLISLYGKWGYGHKEEEYRKLIAKSELNK